MRRSIRGLTMVLGALALAACSRQSGQSTPNSTATTAAAPANVAAPASQPAAFNPPLAPMPSPESDQRPDNVKLDDFLGRIEGEQASLAAADAVVIRDARTALLAGSAQGAKIALATYRAELARELAALPQPPRLSGCYARARNPAETAVGTASGMLAERQAKAAAIGAAADRPLALADFGPLATDISSRTAADAVRASVTTAHGIAAECESAEVRSHRAGPTAQAAASEPASAQAPQVISPPPMPAAAGPSKAGQPSPAPNQPPQPAKKPGFFDRFRGMFH
jgi:hypothetical protein